jgi:hypothetical protein
MVPGAQFGFGEGDTSKPRKFNEAGFVYARFDITFNRGGGKENFRGITTTRTATSCFPRTSVN